MLPRNLADAVGTTMYTFDYGGGIIFGGVVAGCEKSACLALRDGTLRVIDREKLHPTAADALRMRLCLLQQEFDRVNQGLRDCLHRLATLAAESPNA